MVAVDNNVAAAGPPAANLDQGKNGKYDAPIDPIQWVNGNLNQQGAHYIEGYSIPYRCVMTNLPTGTEITIVLEFDIKHSGRHAIDYLTYYDRITIPSHEDVFGHTASMIDPLLGTTGVSGTIGEFTIPAPTSVYSPVPGQPTQSYLDMVANEGIESAQMTLFGGTISNVYYGPQADLNAKQAAQQIYVTFTVDSASAVLAWGGHIASRADWGYDTAGIPLSAGGISGSPYHMRLIDWNLNNLGQQDRSLNAVAVFAPPEPGEICVYKYEDLNGNGIKDANEPLVDGVEITLYNETMVPMAVGVTGDDSNGKVCFLELPLGTYYVEETAWPAGWYASGPTIKMVEIATSAQIVEVFFLDIQYGKICVLKLDVSQQPVMGVEIELWKDGVKVANGTTNASGMICFENLVLGTYVVKEILPAGWYSNEPLSKEVQITTSGQRVDVTFNNIKYGKICVEKLDIAQNAVQGIEIELYKWVDGAWVKQGASKFTDADGKACWDMLLVGDYRVKEILTGDWYTTGSVWSDTLTVTGDSAVPLEWTFVNIKYGKICGYKFFDANINETFEMDTEMGIPNWVIELYIWDETIGDGGDWVYMATTSTDENGHFCFEDLTLGTYMVKEIMQDGWINITSTEQVVVGDVSGFELSVDFGNVLCGPPGHTIGFWANNMVKNANHWTNGIQVSYEDIQKFIWNIDQMYDGVEGLEWLDLTDAADWSGVDEDDMMNAYGILSPSMFDASDMELKARAQILSLLLTAQLYDPDYSESMVYLPDVGDGAWIGTMEDAIAHILQLYIDGNYAAAQELADYLNNLPDSCIWREWL